MHRLADDRFESLFIEIVLNISRDPRTTQSQYPLMIRIEKTVLYRLYK